MEDIKTYKGVYGRTITGEKPKNHGRIWNKEDDELLYDKIITGENYDILSEWFGRSKWAIKLRVMLLAFNRLRDDNFDQILDEFHLNREEFQKFINKKNNPVRNVNPKKIPKKILDKTKILELVDNMREGIFLFDGYEINIKRSDMFLLDY